MANEQMERLVSQAVGQAFDQWAAEHPSLAAALDRIDLLDRATQSLKASSQYQAAMDEFRRSREELDCFNRLLTLAEPILATLLR